MMKLSSNRLAVAIFVVIAGVVIRVDGDKDWWKTTTIYEIWPRSFMDSDGDGIGDLNGITSQLEHFSDMGIETIWIAPVFASPQVDSGYDVSDYLTIDPMYGTNEDMDVLLARANELGIKVVLDYVPNHTSTEHEWFKQSEDSVDPYTDYYIWHEGILDANGTRQPPNNWLSVFNSGSAWEWSDKRQAYYLHQFVVSQPDLDYRNELVLQESKDILTYWLDHGVAGFRIDALTFIYEDTEFRDEPPSGREGYVSTDYYYLDHPYTRDYVELYDLLQIWRDHFDEYNANITDGVERIMFTESYSNLSVVMKYYDYGADFPFNFFLIGDTATSYKYATQSAANLKVIVDEWMTEMPEAGIANWVIGNHDRSRVATRYGTEKVDTFNFLLLLLPGVATIYYGEEIGMSDTYLTWEETEDPQACSTDSTRYTKFSRDPERTPFQWDNTTSGGFSTNSEPHLKMNDNYLTLNLEAQKAADKSYYKNFQGAMKLRGTTVAKDGDLTTRVIDENVFVMSRELDGYDPLLVVFNWANTSVTVSLDEFSNFSEDLVVLLSDMDNDLNVGNFVSRSSITLSAHAALVLTSYDFSCSDSTSTSEVGCLMPYLSSLFNSYINHAEMLKLRRQRRYKNTLTQMLFNILNAL